MSGEPLGQRWRRRAVTVPAMLGATVVGIFGAPLLLPLCAAADLLRLRWRLPTACMYLFLLQYGVNDSVEVLLAPAFYVRTGSVFIPRDDGPAARTACAALGRSLADGALGLIFPEGRLFRPDRLVRSLERLVESDPVRAERLAGLGHVLRPRPGGTLALLDAAPDAGVVVLAHAGFEADPTLGVLARAVPVRAPIRVAAWRIPRAEIRSDPAEQVIWLDDLWCDLDVRVALLKMASRS
jgi:hypothetical protein